MSGGLLQLVSFGAADIHLVGQPQITFWRQVWRRHTNFAIEATLQTPHGSFNFNKKVSVTISRTADMINKCYLEVVLPQLPPIYDPSTPTASSMWKLYNSHLSSSWMTTMLKDGQPRPPNDYYCNWVQDVGLALIKSVELEVGGSRIDRHTSEFMHIWSSLTVPPQKRNAFNRMIGHVENSSRGLLTNQPVRLYIPLMFFFNEYGLSLPLIAISYNDIKLNFELRSAQELLQLPSWLTTRTPPIKFNMPDDAHFNLDTCNLYADMVHLDQTERRRMAKSPHEMLITNVQYLGDEIVTDTTPQMSAKWPLNFSHPCKEIVWVFINDNNVEGGIFDYADVFDEIQLQMNGHLRLSPRKASYFYLVQPWQHHTNTPDKPIHCFSFGLHPELPQPSGQMNFSRLDQANLIATFKNSSTHGRLKIFAISFNLLRISNGLAALAYTN